MATPQQLPRRLTPRPTRDRQKRPRVLGEELFRDVLVRERKRADRSNKALGVVLVTVHTDATMAASRTWRTIADALDAVKRETDVAGWFKRYETLGLILSEVPSDPSFSRRLGDRVRCELVRRLDAQTADCVLIQLFVHPTPEAAQADGLQPVDSVLWSGPATGKRRAYYEAVKRGLDILFSAILLVLSSPIFLLVAALMKLTSRGPVLFRQERIGQMMTPFVMLKFRTMRVDADHEVHRQFVSSFIKSGSQGGDAGGTDGLFKIVNDSRVTPIGRLLRRTSLDELPQLWNVLIGDMSLVGPRPPLPYEVAQYEAWHRRRVLEAKPGLTGLWQVTGRSRTTFDEMVRLDLRYAKACSLSTDLRILLATPRAVISGKGAC